MGLAFGRAVDSASKSLPAISEGGQTADGRWNPPTNFGQLIGDLLSMRNLAQLHLGAGDAGSGW